MAKRIDVITLGFGTTVAMWTVGFLCRMPPSPLPSKWVFQLILTCMLCGGFIAGRYDTKGWLAGLEAGTICAVLNLLILGGLLSSANPGAILPPSLLWLPGWILLGALVGATGAAVGAQVSYRDAAAIRWTPIFAHVAAVATMVLLAVGGLVTSNEAGLAVVDWPNSFGHNMFLYPLSRMTGGIYYEHAHRLFGSLVGLTTVALALHLQQVEQRGWVKRLGWLALLAVIIQGTLGGLRVTGHFTLSVSPSDMSPSVILAVVHGVLGQLFFALMVTIGLVTTRSWEEIAKAEDETTAGIDRGLNALLLVLLVIQLVFGALLRHVSSGLLIHVTLGAVVVMLAAGCGARAWGLYQYEPKVHLSGRTLIIVAALQLTLGLSALAAIGARGTAASPTSIEVALTTAHQVVGAALLALVVMLLLSICRILAPDH